MCTYFYHHALRTSFNYQTVLCIRYHVFLDLVTLWNANTSYELSSFFLKNPILWTLQRPEIKGTLPPQEWFSSPLFQTVGVANTLGSFSWEKKHLKWNRVCPPTVQTRGAHQAVPRGTGILSSLFLYTSLKTCSCPGRPIVRSSLESSTFLVPGWSKGDNHCRIARTAMTQTTRWTVSFLTIAKDWKCGCGLQVWNASIVTKHAGGSPWPPLLSSPCSPRRCQWSRRRPRGKATPSWTRRIRTLVCDSLDGGNLLSFS